MTRQNTTWTTLTDSACRLAVAIDEPAELPMLQRTFDLSNDESMFTLLAAGRASSDSR